MVLHPDHSYLLSIPGYELRIWSYYIYCQEWGRKKGSKVIASSADWHDWVLI